VDFKTHPGFFVLKSPGKISGAFLVWKFELENKLRRPL